MEISAIFKNIFIMMIGLLISSCEVDNEPLTTVDGQEVFFEVNYINYAWGEQASGFLIDKFGKVNSYKGKAKWYSDESKGQLTESQMKDNLALASNVSTQIQQTDLIKYTNLISKISVEKYSKKTAVGADMGLYTYIAYTYNASERVYKAIKLAEEGDWRMYNEDPNAKLITEWLKSIQPAALKN
jgi:hypothetical protein